MLRNLFLFVPFLLLVHVPSALALPKCCGNGAYNNCTNSDMAVLMISERMFKSLITVVPETVFSLSSRNWAMWLELRLESLMVEMCCWHSLLVRDCSWGAPRLTGVNTLPYFTSKSCRVQSWSGESSPNVMALSVFSPHILASVLDLNVFDTIGRPRRRILTR